MSARTRVEVCLRELNQWMLLNNLRLNNDKTELLVLHAKHRPKPPLDSITVGDATVEPTSSARNIGVSRNTSMNCAGLLSIISEILVAYNHALVSTQPKHWCMH